MAYAALEERQPPAFISGGVSAHELLCSQCSAVTKQRVSRGPAVPGVPVLDKFQRKFVAQVGPGFLMGLGPWATGSQMRGRRSQSGTTIDHMCCWQGSAVM